MKYENIDKAKWLKKEVERAFSCQKDLINSPLSTFRVFTQYLSREENGFPHELNGAENELIEKVNQLCIDVVSAEITSLKKEIAELD